MDTTDRMMIMGMCLQGLLANPNVYDGGFTSTDPVVAARGEAAAKAARAWVVAEAHRIADLLDPPPQVTDAQVIAQLTRTAYGVIVAADTDGSGGWKNFDDGRSSLSDTDADRVDGVFERVSRWYQDPTGFPETTQDRIIAAVVAAHRATTDRAPSYQQPLFDTDAKGG